MHRVSTERVAINQATEKGLNNVEREPACPVRIPRRRHRSVEFTKVCRDTRLDLLNPLSTKSGEGLLDCQFLVWL